VKWTPEIGLDNVARLFARGASALGDGDEAHGASVTAADFADAPMKG